MASAKSPFKIYQHFLSAKLCEIIVDATGFCTPDVDASGKPIKMFRHHEPSSNLIYSQFKHIIPKIEQYYDFNHRGTEDLTFEYISEGCTSQPLCENSTYIHQKWVRVRDRDITGLLFLSKYQDQVPFDTDYEVYGGKLEFPQHDFGFNPERGTLILYPSGPHFINAFSPIITGDLFAVRFHLTGHSPYLYNPQQFPGDYKTWFTNLT